MNETVLRVAIIGLRHGMSHVGALRRQSRARLTALVDIQAERLAEARQHVAAEVTAFADVHSMLAAQIADVAVVAVPTAAHAEVAIACLDAGLHVLLEKPLCRNDQEAARIAAAVQRSGKVFQVGYEVRSSPLHQTILRHIAAGDLGQVTNVWWHQHTDQTKADYDGWRRKRAEMGGALFDCSPHFLDLIGQWAGAPPVRLVALGNLCNRTGPCAGEVLPESAAIAIEYANGVRGTFNFGAVNKFKDDATFGIAGTTGCIRGNPIDAGRYELRSDAGVRVSQVVFDPRHTTVGHLGFNEQWTHFLDTIRTGAPNVCAFADALAVHRLMTAIDRSLSTGKVIELSAGPKGDA